MKLQLKHILPSMIVTLVILICLEVLTTAFFPAFGLMRFRIPFNVLIILFVAFKLDTPYSAILILIIQLFHSLFSLEGWAMGTFAGVIIYIIISVLRDVIHFSSSLLTIMVTQLFQLLWFLMVSFFLYLKLGSTDYIIDKFWRFLPESIIISLIAPYCFSLLDKIWKVKDGGSLREDS